MDTIDTIDRALYIRIKVEHPSWPEEVMLGEIKRLKNEAIQEWVTKLINKQIGNYD